MQRIAKFYKVSEERFAEDLKATAPVFTEAEIHKIYEELPLPSRATKGSAGYDFFSPIPFTLRPGESIRIPTGIRVEIQDGWFLGLYPRSGLGFKYRMQLNNTVGIIDSDYFYSDNEGHIMAKLTNDSREEKHLHVERNTAFMQGIFTAYGITEDDDANELRNGGFGSTSK